MKKLLSALIILFSLGTSAQTNYFDMSAGPSLAFGQLSSRRPSGGYASPTGFHLGFNFARVKESGFGWTAGMQGGGHGLQQNALKNSYAQNGAQATFNDTSLWTLITMTGGLAYIKTIGNFFVDVRLQGGFLFGEPPYVETDKRANLSRDQWKFQNNNMECYAGLAIMPMARVGYQVCERVYVTTGADLVASRASYKVKYEGNTGENPVPAFEETYTINHFLSRVHLGVGVKW